MLEMLVFHNMKDKIKNIIKENLPDAVCKFDGDSCNLKLEVSSKKLEKTVSIGIKTNEEIINDIINQIFKFLGILAIYILN